MSKNREEKYRGKNKNSEKNRGAGKAEKAGKTAKTKSVFALFISPTHNTEDASRAVARGIARKVSGGDFFSIDITSPEAREGVYEFGEDDVVVIGCPTYAGRLPNKLMPFFEEAVFGQGALGVSLVTYGNRAYDDSLKELSDIMLTNDFTLVSAVAVPSEHAFVPELATGRPNEDDITALIKFGEKIGESIAQGKAKGMNIEDIPGRPYEEMKYYVPKKEDGEPASFLKAMPVTDKDKCTGCKACRQVCPMDCYKDSLWEPSGICIKCQGCIKACPVGAKHFENEDFESHKRYLKENYSNKESDIEFYIGE